MRLLTAGQERSFEKGRGIFHQYQCSLQYGKSGSLSDRFPLVEHVESVVLLTKVHN